jgi:DinB family protein
MTSSARFDELRTAAPDIVLAWDGIDAEQFLSVRREVRRRTGPGTAARLVPQLAVTGEALAAVIRSLPDVAFAMPGGEEDWTVAQAVGHAADARAGLAMAASLAAQGRFPADAPEVIPGIPGPADVTRDHLLRRLATSQRVIERAARAIAGHEVADCPLVHPLVGRLRCGEWLLFAGVHDLMHLEQLEALEARSVVGVAAAPTPAG